MLLQEFIYSRSESLFLPFFASFFCHHSVHQKLEILEHAVCQSLWILQARPYFSDLIVLILLRYLIWVSFLIAQSRPPNAFSVRLRSLGEGRVPRR